MPTAEDLRCPTCSSFVDTVGDLKQCKDHPEAARYCPDCSCAICGLDKKENLGPTGEFPGGKVVADDEGELRLAIGIQDKLVFLSFGKPINWLAMPTSQMRELIENLEKLCNQADRKG